MDETRHARSPLGVVFGRRIELSPRAQAFGAAGVAALMLWTLVSGGWMALESWRSVEERAAYAAAEESWRSRLAETEAALAAAQSNLQKAEARAEAAVSTLAREGARGAEQAAKLRALAAALQDSRDRERKLEAFRADAVRLEQVQADRDGLSGALLSLADRLSATAAERDEAHGFAAELERAMSRMEGEAARREELLNQLGHAAELSIAPLETMLRGAGVDVDSIVRSLKRAGSGGPFVPLANAVEAMEPERGERIAAVVSDLERVNLLRAAASRMPFAKPVKQVRLSSRFGPRRDPINRRAAMHQGLDFRGPRGTAIMATADGVVSFSGRQRGYGNVVKVRHDFGFETVYAHLNKRRVSVGERVEAGDRIGDMGSTGRSTGVHLHYEIRVNGRPVDPLTFIEASRNVL